MTLQVPDEKIPLLADENGIARIAGTRVTLDCVLEMFHDGASPEEIADEYDALQLGDVYAVLTYCLRHEDEVNRYLLRETRDPQYEYQTIQNRFPPTLRAKLLAAMRARRS